MIEEVVRKITCLRTDKNRKKWSGLTCHQAPYKPFLLLSIMDHFAEGLITENFVEPSLDLIETFNVYWKAVMPPGTSGNMVYPFPRLQNDGILFLIPNPDWRGEIDIQSVTSIKRLREVSAGARLDDNLFLLFSHTEAREQLRAAVINHYFDGQIRPAVAECGEANVKAYEYSLNLLKVSENIIPFAANNSEDTRNRKIRDQGFRKAVVVLYEHRCALCGIRMLTPEGYTVVEAAHVKPWSESHDDRPTNGMSLCRLCHWSFDEGLMSVGKDYEVMISKLVTTERNYPGHILTLSDRTIVRPADQSFWPAQENLAWHRDTKFSK